MKWIISFCAVVCMTAHGASARQDFAKWQPIYSSAKPRLDWSRAPAFPTEEIAAGANGGMTFQVCTDETGRATSAEATRDGGMSEKVIKTTADWILSAEFKPALGTDRQPIAVCQTKLQFMWMSPNQGARAEAYPLQPILVPEYPAAARRRGEAGRTTAMLCIDASGEVTDVESVAPAGSMLAFAFEDWLRQTIFAPVLENGQAVPACGLTFELNWSLSER